MSLRGKVALKRRFVGTRQRQRGVYDLISLGIAATIAIAFAATQLWQQRQQVLSQQVAAQGNVVADIGNGVNSQYLTKYYSYLVNGTPIPGVANPYSPTMAELKALNAVPAELSTTSGYGFPYVVALAKTPAGCVAPNCDISGMVFVGGAITDPSSGAPLTLEDGAAAIGGDGGYSDTVTPGLITGMSGQWSQPNPMGNVPGVLAMRVGYGSSGWSAFLRRDGTLPMEGNLNLKGSDGTLHDLKNVGTVNATNTITGTLEVTGLAVEGSPCAQLGLIASNSAGKLLACNGTTWGKATDMPNAHRYVFTSTTNWTVPTGVKSALVTMAGGGASGYGWRFSNQYQTGSTGGFVFSAPVNLNAGETLNIVVGNGGQGFGAIDTGVVVPNTPNYHVWGPPPGDDGLGGYPGTASQLISPSQGVLLECDGGSGAWVGGVDDFSGSLVPGPQNGAESGSGRPNYGAPNRVAGGPYASQGGPGACGPANYGVGNWGQQSWSMTSGSHPGAVTPFGYGSGGSVVVSGCYVSTTQMGTCTSASYGRDGVVMIDVLY